MHLLPSASFCLERVQQTNKQTNKHTHAESLLQVMRTTGPKDRSCPSLRRNGFTWRRPAALRLPETASGWARRRVRPSSTWTKCRCQSTNLDHSSTDTEFHSLAVVISGHDMSRDTAFHSLTVVIINHDLRKTVTVPSHCAVTTYDSYGTLVIRRGRAIGGKRENHLSVSLLFT